MSKIIIREIDNTIAGVNQTNISFNVVVPGFVAADKGSDGFDDNGICECHSIKDFEDYIGFTDIEVTEQVEAEEATVVTHQIEDEETSYTIPERAKIYTRTKITEEAEKQSGKLVAQDEADGEWYRYTFDFISDGKGYFTEPTYEIAEGNEGRDAVEIHGPHYGNQIAYELLSLGYTVLYKELTALTDLNNDNYWECLKDKTAYQFRFITHGLKENCKDANNAIARLASFSDKADIEDTGRGDCVALLEVGYDEFEDATTQSEIINAIKTAVSEYVDADKYSAIFANPVTYNLENPEIDSTTKAWNDNKTFPAYFHYLACFAKSKENYAEWYAISNYARGVSKFTVANTAKKLGEAAVNALQPRNISSNNNTFNKAVNLVIKDKNNYILWGNRTAHVLGVAGQDDGDLVASHFLNIRQLCATIKQQTYHVCRKYTFEPNNDTLWFNFCNAIKPTLEAMKADQGIADYEFIKESVNKKALLKASIRIVPIEPVEDFEINLYLEDSLGGAAAIEITE